MSAVELRVARWGNSLAVRLPADYARRTGLKEGDALVMDEAPDGTLSLAPAKPFDRKTFARRLAKFTATMSMGTSVMDEVRRGARY